MPYLPFATDDLAYGEPTWILSVGGGTMAESPEPAGLVPHLFLLEEQSGCLFDPVSQARPAADELLGFYVDGDGVAASSSPRLGWSRTPSVLADGATRKCNVYRSDPRHDPRHLTPDTRADNYVPYLPFATDDLAYGEPTWILSVGGGTMVESPEPAGLVPDLFLLEEQSGRLFHPVSAATRAQRAARLLCRRGWRRREQHAALGLESD